MVPVLRFRKSPALDFTTKELLVPFGTLNVKPAALFVSILTVKGWPLCPKFNVVPYAFTVLLTVKVSWISAVPLTFIFPFNDKSSVTINV